MNIKYKSVVFVLSLLFLAAIFQGCNSKSKTSEGEVDPNLKLYTVKSLIDTSDGISETEYNNKSPIEVSGAQGTLFYYNVNLIGPDGKSVEELKGSGTTDSDGKFKPVINWSKPYNSLACGEYKIQISVFTNAERTVASTNETMVTFVCLTVKPNFDSKKGIISESQYAQPYSFTAAAGNRVYYRYKIDYVYTDSTGDKTETLKEDISGDYISTGTDSPSPVWKNNYAALTCKGYTVTVWADIKPITGTTKMEPVNTFVPCNPGNYETACGNIATEMTPGKTETISVAPQKDYTGIIRVGEYKDRLDGESCSDICSGYGGKPSFDSISKAEIGSSNYFATIFGSLFNSCNINNSGTDQVEWGTLALIKKDSIPSFSGDSLSFYTNKTSISQYTPIKTTYPGAMVCMCTN